MGPKKPVDLEPTVLVKSLHVGFAGREVLHNLNAKFNRGWLAVVLGRSGSGKTTFLRALNRLNECFPRSATRGSLKLKLQGEWRDIYRNAMPLPELRRRVGMVFQTPHLLPGSIADNLALPVKLVLGVPRRNIASRVEWALEEAHLWDEVKDRLNAPAHTLSGGQQQRLCLARLLALEPEILLLDEPTASLDFRAALKVEELLLSLKERYTIIAVSHSLSQARRLADEALIFRDGSVVQRLSREDLQAPDTLQALLEEIF
ncbi:MAG: phosphate ABC transporter ATP-binding protein [Proteobacteria bacterium]|nr:phosphate ABC transporter ATP-binding protein [Pseudomonadota bacterium]MBU4355964.1 phosphate ABC transporter ATP-binding protein [Pseudomonadota bacterium]MBU4448913.1 phosphate ABC transporter ATP-binding protein [Pseudomonadota bacterium]MCG2772236.1 phosphate ABC transporter ATP-binding protein [Desulfobacterales bacterium]